MTTTEVVTPYSTITPYISGYPTWIPTLDQERVAAYAQYEKMYWNLAGAFPDMIIVEEEGKELLIPNPRKIVDSTVHYLMKGLKVGVDGEGEHKTFLEAFLAREEFDNRWSVAKHAGVVRGDWLFHITANPDAAEGSRISLTSIDPGAYFPVYDPDDLNNRIGVRLVEQQVDENDDTKVYVKLLQYGYTESGSVWRQEDLWQLEGWNDPDKAELVKTLLPYDVFPPEITQIPVYHFKYGQWDGDPFGSSELKGFERLFEAISQTVTDTDTALSLAGLGAYATDASHPINSQGREIDWTIAPGKVLEVPGATMFKRLEGIASITPVKDYLEYLERSLYEGSGTSEVALGRVDSTTAESPMTLAIKFAPTEAKLEGPDNLCLNKLTQMFYDIRAWFKIYESINFDSVTIKVTIGAKLPINRTKVVEELNNMLDRKVISRAYYRTKIAEFGYEFPANIEEEILAEEEKFAEIAMANQEAAVEIPGPGGRKQGPGDTLDPAQRSRSNNTRRVNESKGTEIDANR